MMQPSKENSMNHHTNNVYIALDQNVDLNKETPNYFQFTYFFADVSNAQIPFSQSPMTIVTGYAYAEWLFQETNHLNFTHHLFLN